MENVLNDPDMLCTDCMCQDVAIYPTATVDWPEITGGPEIEYHMLQNTGYSPISQVHYYCLLAFHYQFSAETNSNGMILNLTPICYLKNIYYL